MWFIIVFSVGFGSCRTLLEQAKGVSLHLQNNQVGFIFSFSFAWKFKVFFYYTGCECGKRLEVAPSLHSNGSILCLWAATGTVKYIHFPLVMVFLKVQFTENRNLCWWRGGRSGLILPLVFQAEAVVKAVMQEVDDTLRFLHSQVDLMTDRL